VPKKKKKKKEEEENKKRFTNQEKNIKQGDSRQEKPKKS